MNLATAVIIGNQVINNIQTARMQAQLGDIYSQLEGAESHRQRQSLLKQTLYSLNQFIDELEHNPQSDAYDYYLLRNALYDAQRHGLSVQALEEISDKEYAATVLGKADTILYSCRQNLGPDAIDALDFFLWANRALPLYRQASAWSQIRDLLPRIVVRPTLPRFLLCASWPAFILWFCISRAPAELAKSDSFQEAVSRLTGLLVAFGIFAGPFVILLILAIVFRTRLPECERIARANGLQLTGTFARRHIVEALHDTENQIADFGGKTFRTSKEYQDKVGSLQREMQATIDRFTLPLRLNP